MLGSKPHYKTLSRSHRLEVSGRRSLVSGKRVELNARPFFLSHPTPFLRPETCDLN